MTIRIKVPTKNNICCFFHVKLKPKDLSHPAVPHIVLGPLSLRVMEPDAPEKQQAILCLETPVLTWFELQPGIHLPRAMSRQTFALNSLASISFQVQQEIVTIVQHLLHEYTPDSTTVSCLNALYHLLTVRPSRGQYPLRLIPQVVPVRGIRWFCVDHNSSILSD